MLWTLIWLIIIAVVVAADQISKMLAVRFLAGADSFDVIDGVLRFTYTENRGAAFGMLDDKRWIFMVISTVAIIALLAYLVFWRPESKLACVSLSLIIGGGIGNMIDRVVLGYVIDFIDFCAFPTIWMWIFNIADACVCVGGAMLFVWCLISLIKEARAEKARGGQTEDSSADNTED